MICRRLRRHPPGPSEEAVEEQREMTILRERVEDAARETDRLLRENNYSARIRALYLGRHA